MNNMKQITGYETLEEIRFLLNNQDEIYLSAAALCNFINAAIENRLTTSELQLCADFLECERVNYEEAKSELIAKTLFEISSPEINGEMDKNRYRLFINSLRFSN